MQSTQRRGCWTRQWTRTVIVAHHVFLHGKRHYNRACEVFRSNKESQGCWDQDEDGGFTGCRTLIYAYAKAEATGLCHKEWRATWIHPRRRELLQAQGYVRQNTKGRRSSRPRDYTIIEDEDNTWAATRPRSPRVV